jgi:hypothetical protein
MPFTWRRVGPWHSLTSLTLVELPARRRAAQRGSAAGESPRPIRPCCSGASEESGAGDDRVAKTAVWSAPFAPRGQCFIEENEARLDRHRVRHQRRDARGRRNAAVLERCLEHAGTGPRSDNQLGSAPPARCCPRRRASRRCLGTAEIVPREPDVRRRAGARLEIGRTCQHEPAAVDISC